MREEGRGDTGHQGGSAHALSLLFLFTHHPGKILRVKEGKSKNNSLSGIRAGLLIDFGRGVARSVYLLVSQSL